MAATSRELQVSPPIHRLGPPGRWIRSQLQAGILHGTPVVLLIQNLRTPFTNSLMQVISFLGEEECYTLLLALIVWVFDAKLGRLLALLMAIGFYLTGVCKNLLCLPRPPCPPIIPLRRCNDWSLPSHHALLGASIPWYIWFYTSLNYNLGTYTSIVLFTAIALWSFCVIFSRVYLGVHSPADIVSGGIMGCLILAVWLQIDTTLDNYIASSGKSLLLVLLTLVLLLYIHPDPPPTTIIYTETLCMFGVASGFIMARAHASPSILYAAMERSHTYSSIATLVCCSIARFFLGMVMILGLKTVVGAVSKSLLMYVGGVIGVHTVCIKRQSAVTSERVHYSPAFTVAEEPTTSSNDPWQWTTDAPLNLDIIVKFLSYISVGLVAVEGAPYAFQIIGI